MPLSEEESPAYEVLHASPKVSSQELLRQAALDDFFQNPTVGAQIGDGFLTIEIRKVTPTKVEVSIITETKSVTDCACKIFNRTFFKRELGNHLCETMRSSINGLDVISPTGFNRPALLLALSGIGVLGVSHLEKPAEA